MRKGYLVQVTLLGLWASVLINSGCARTQSSRFYLLQPLAENAAATNPAERDLTIGVGPVVIPKYLDRPQMVTRTSKNELNLAEFDRWAEPVGDNLTQVLADDLSTILGTQAVMVYPWSGSTIFDYQITVSVLRFDGELGGNAVLIARWTIIEGESKSKLLTEKSTFSESSGGPDYEALVSAQNRTLAALSREMAQAIRDASANRHR